MSDVVGKRIGDYEVLKVLGAGGMGRVYQVRNVITDRVEAMKVLLPDLEGHEGVAARFLREIKVLAALNHPNIAALHTAQTIDNQLVMIMEYVEGQSLSARISRGPIPVPDALNYLDQVLSALSYAHHRHVIHRDIKPANLMLTSAGVVKLMDFGIARTDDEPSKLTATGSTLGSMNYMSPEQVRGEKVDERSDLYSLGISLYEMVTGEKPFQGDSNFSIMAAHINQPPRPPVELHPGIPGIVNDLILTAIAKAPTQRYQTADSFRAAVQQAMQAASVDDRTSVEGSLQTAFAVPTPPPAVRNTPPVASQGVPLPPPIPPATRPVPAAYPAAPPPAANRGLYMGLGALVLIAVVILAGIYLPGKKKAEAADTQAPSQTVSQPQVQNSAPAQSSSAQAPVPQAPAEAQQTTQVASAASAPAKLSSKKALVQSAVPDNAQAQAAKGEAAAREAELDAVEHDIDQLSSRAGAVNSGLDNLARQQAAAGYGLRGDMASKQSSMKLNLSKAQDAIAHNDAARAKRYAAMASSDIEALEKFLGR
jgi:serine/threonine protein kinase